MRQLLLLGWVICLKEEYSSHCNHFQIQFRCKRNSISSKINISFLFIWNKETVKWFHNLNN
uniref:Uncharacterized protein n=1 Tax=Rhizophora mucronata TaxID=61149 RepID=A0A2P2NHQ2_RHIMU